MKKRILKVWGMIEGSIAIIRLIRSPNQLDRVFEISRRLADPKVLNGMAEHVVQGASEAQTALQAKPRLDLTVLYADRQNLPTNSLGAEFLKFLESHNLNPKDIPTLPSKTTEEFVQAHLYETHDIWHVMCGFETDEAGELGLQAFYLAQLPSPLSAILLGVGFMNTALFALNEREKRMQEIVRGWSLGKKSKPLFGVDWNQLWMSPLKDLRAEFGIT